jgi:peptide/nickel transport system substrate-binding protein
VYRHVRKITYRRAVRKVEEESGVRRPLLVLASLVVAGGIAASPTAGVPAQTPRSGGTLVIRVLGPEPACLNVLPMSCNQGGQAYWSEKVLQTPFAVGPNFTYEESLVSRVDYTRRRPFTLTYHIRPEARWSDGVAITAQDFIFTLRAIRRHATPEFRELHAPIRSVRAADPKTVQVVLRPRSASWHDFFGNILPAHALRGADLAQVWGDRVDNPRTGRPIGSGPFLVERFERGRQLVLRRNPRYWGPHPAYVDRLVIRFAQSATDPSEELKSRELTIAMGVPAPVVPAVRRQPGLRFVTGAGSNFEQLAIQLGPNAHPALRSKLVRRALAYGIDRTALVRQIWGEIDPSARALDSAVYLTQSRDYEPNWRAYRYRPAEARRLLEQAGCRRGADGIFSCGGQRLSLRFVTSAGIASRAQALSLIQSQLRAAGVEVVPVFAPGAAFIGQILPQGAFDVALFSWAGAPAGSWAPVFGCGGLQNFTGYCQRLVSAHLNDADRILDSRRRARVLNKADRGLASDVPTIPLYQFVATAAYDTSVRSFVFLPWNPLWNAENWWLAGSH